MKDRLSIHIDNGQSNIYEAVSILRNGGLPSQSGLVGITNKTHTSSEPPVTPQTIFNIQSTGQSDIRFSSLSKSKSNLELLGNGNGRVSGLLISYDPITEISPIMEFSEIQHENGSGIEIGFQRMVPAFNGGNYVGIGTTSIGDNALFNAMEPLTIYHSGTVNSGTIALKEQSNKPSASSSYGKVYVKPYMFGDQSQSLFFLDDVGNEYNLSPSKFDYFNGLVYGDEYGNTYAGWYTPEDRSVASSRNQNTFFGWGAGNNITTGDQNTVVGHLSGSGITRSRNNTIIGNQNYTNNTGDNNIIIGSKNVTLSDLELGDLVKYEGSNSILIGTGLYSSDNLTDYTLAIGYGENPLVEGSLGGSNGRRFALKSTTTQPATLSIDATLQNFELSNGAEDFSSEIRPVGIFNFIDTQSSLESKGRASIRFSNRFNNQKTLMDFDPSGEYNIVPTFETPEVRRPFVSVSGDINLLGAIRFSNGTSIDSVYDISLKAASGITEIQQDNENYHVLDFENLDIASSRVDQIDTANSYLAIDANDRINPSVTKIGKISIQSLAEYVGSGFASVANNCNHIWSNLEADIDRVNNSQSIFIGCNVASDATGWKNSTIIGTEAGRYATVNNPSLASDTAVVFLGYQAGKNTSNVENSVFIGSSAGLNADSSSNSIFIGFSAGENSTNSNSIGIGKFALDGELSEAEGGSNNIEIVAGLLTNQRLMYTKGNLSNRINIQNAIAGDTEYKYLSIGSATLTPTSPLEVKRNYVGDKGHSGENIQTWWNYDGGENSIARINTSGELLSNVAVSGGTYTNTEAYFGHFEGFMDVGVGPAASYDLPQSGTMTVKNSQFANGDKIWVTNRDPKLEIHGPGSDGGTAFVITTRINGENRPIYVSCSGT